MTRSTAIAFCLFALFSISTVAQVATESTISEAVDVEPMYPGGEDALFKMIHESLIYPHQALVDELQGEVTTAFTIERDGSVSDLQIVKGIREDLDAEALRVLSGMETWSAGMRNGHPVKVEYTLVTAFKLDNLLVQEGKKKRRRKNK